MADAIKIPIYVFEILWKWPTVLTIVICGEGFPGSRREPLQPQIGSSVVRGLHHSDPSNTPSGDF